MPTCVSSFLGPSGQPAHSDGAEFEHFFVWTHEEFVRQAFEEWFQVSPSYSWLDFSVLDIDDIQREFDVSRFQAHPAAVLILSYDAVELLPKFYHSSALLTHLALILKTEFDNLAVLQETSFMSAFGISELNFDNLHGVRS